MPDKQKRRVDELSNVKKEELDALLAEYRSAPDFISLQHWKVGDTYTIRVVYEDVDI